MDNTWKESDMFTVHRERQLKYKFCFEIETNMDRRWINFRSIRRRDGACTVSFCTSNMDSTLHVSSHGESDAYISPGAQSPPPVTGTMFVTSQSYSAGQAGGGDK
jgi:hypothetical protein